MDKPTTIKLFLVKGQPDGLRTAEISNWSGLAIAGPRSDLSALKAREELQAPGIYVLIGTDEVSGHKKIYIGEAENVSKRLGSKKHANKEFWVSVIGFVAKDNNLTKGHIRYLEGQLIDIAKDRNVNLDNEQSTNSNLPESDRADMDEYLSKVFQLLPVLGLNEFEKPETIESDSSEWLYCKIKGLLAKGRRTNSGFLVAAGSQAVKQHRQSAKISRHRRDDFLAEGLLVDAGDHLEFSQDIEFSSPSAAGSIVRGGSTNGLTVWKNRQGLSLKEIEELGS